MSKDFNPRDWYWRVNGDAERVYSSKAGDYVQATDAAFLAWSADGTLPTRIVSEAELGEVLSQHSVRPAAATILDGYREAQAGRLTIEIVAKVLLWCVNEIRALKSQQALNANQFRAFIKGLL